MAGWRLRPDQMNVLAEMAEDAFAADCLGSLLREHPPTAGTSNVRPREVLLDWMRHCEGLEIVDEEHVEPLLTAVASRGFPRFDALPESVQENLSHPNRPAAWKVERLEEQLASWTPSAPAPADPARGQNEILPRDSPLRPRVHAGGAGLRPSRIGAGWLEGEWVGSGRAFAVVDACASPAAARMVEEGEPGCCSLFEGTWYEEYWAVGPVLATLDRPVWEWIRRELWGGPWGALLLAGAEVVEVASHVKGLLTAETPAGEELLLRFYDPRVLSALLGTMDGAEARAFFGPIAAFAAASEDSPDEELALWSRP